ncbi:MAG TPA: pyridoxine 5'-phosphate synthase [Longimicrobium sp.]|nr:pyridoxine 5'-phosphate synthase [Longimicrobium sp.]
MSGVSLSINLNKVALLRNQRDLDLPDVLRAARLCLEAGAHGITVHPRPDERHTRRDDVLRLAPLVRGAGAEFNVEGYPSDDFLDLVLRAGADQCTLVPDDPGQRTSDHGWNVEARRALLERALGRLRAAGIRTSLFMDAATPADAERIAGAAEVGADRVELYTEPYARAFGGPEQETVLASFVDAARMAAAAGLGVNAGHDLNLRNLPRFAAVVPGLLEVSIGHAFTADALEMGYRAAVRAYLDALAGTAATA